MKRYIGQTGKKLVTPIDKHHLTVKWRDQVSVFLVHEEETGQSFHLDDLSILGPELAKRTRDFIGLMFSTKHSINKHINLDRMYEWLRFKDNSACAHSFQTPGRCRFVPVNQLPWGSIQALMYHSTRGGGKIKHLPPSRTRGQQIAKQNRSCEEGNSVKIDKWDVAGNGSASLPIDDKRITIEKWTSAKLIDKPGASYYQDHSGLVKKYQMKKDPTEYGL